MSVVLSVDEEKPSVPGGCSNEATYVQHCYTGGCVAPVLKPDGRAPVGRALAPVGRALAPVGRALAPVGRA